MKQPMVKVGLATVVLAALGWLITLVALPLSQQPSTTEDLTGVWTDAGDTRLGQQSTVTVPPGQTLVAFLVGTDLYGVAGTTGGSCAATAEGRPLRLAWPVLINRSLQGILKDGQQTVPVAGWTNHANHAVAVGIYCKTTDSTVTHFVAVPSRTAVIPSDPWFQPWGWLALGVAGAALTAVGVLGISRPSR